MPQFRAAFESSPTGLLIIDSNGCITLANREVERLFGYSREELQGRAVEMLVPERYRNGHPRFRTSFFNTPKTRRMGAGRDLYGLRKDGVEVPLEIGLTPVETRDGNIVISSIVDISDRKHCEAEQQKVEEQLRQAQKMEALGQLASGIAHDINTILQAILGNAELARVNAAACQHADDIDEIIANVKRGKRVVERILTFTRQKKLDLQPLDLKKHIEETFRLLRATLPAEITIKLDVEPGLPHILADVTSVDQILVNLANNAAQAMTSRGNLDITLEPFYAHDNFVKMNPELKEGWYVRLMVRDSGTGMNEAVKQRAYDPFFTTKAPGCGTGLGLSMVHGLVGEHGGKTWLESEIDSGTTVSCLFPAVDAERVDYRGDEISIPYGNFRRIMCVDDESALQAINERILSGLGYKPSIFLDPREALDTFKYAADDFDLAMIDYSMPYMNGIKLISELLKIRPGFAVVLVSGSVKGIVAEQYRKIGAKALIRKPFTRLELAHSLFSIFNPDIR